MATGDAEIHLPRIPPASLVAAGLTPAAVYRLLVAEHVARLERGTPGHAPGDPETPEHLLYELCEAVAAEQWLARTLPGLVADLTAARKGALAERPGLVELRPVERAIEQLVQRVLAAPPTAAVPEVPLAATPAESRAWAYARCALLPADGGRCRGLPPVPQWGRVLVVQRAGGAGLARRVTAFHRAVTRPHSSSPAVSSPSRGSTGGGQPFDGYVDHPTR